MTRFGIFKRLFLFLTLFLYIFLKLIYQKTMIFQFIIRLTVVLKKSITFFFKEDQIAFIDC